jgi:predicted HTH domain antitoxin
MQMIIETPNMANVSEFEMKMMLASKLYESRRMSLGYCADIAGLSKRSFIELLGNYGVSVFSQNADELKADMKNAEQYFK